MQKLKDLLIKISNIDVYSLSNTDVLNFLISISSLLVAILSFIVAMIVLFYTGYQFFLKKGSKFYGIYSISSSVWSKQSYVGEIIIENKKDKSSAISYVYLRIGSNIYVELVDYSHSPRIVSPFETIKIQLKEGVSGYISSTFKVDIGHLLSDRKIPKNLMVATPEGLSKVKNYKKFWNVYIESLRNNFIVPVRPVKKYYKDKEYSDGLQFVVIDKNSEGRPNEHFLYRGNTYSINGVSVKTDDFSNAEDLQIFLIDSIKPVGNTLMVERVNYTYSDFDDYKEVDIDHIGFFGTHVIGKVYTKFSSWKFRRKNKIKKR